MSSDDFQKRLQRINQGTPSQAESAPQVETPAPTGRKKTAAKVAPVRSADRILGVLLGGTAAAMVAVFVLFGTETMRSGAADAATSPTAQSSASGEDITWFDRIVMNWIGGPLATGGASDLAASHLPAAPEGWILVTTEDVLGGGGYERAAERYAALDPTVPFEQNLGQNWLASMIRSYETPDFEANVYKETKGRGIYMSREGHFLFALLEFRSKSKQLAPTPDARNAQLLAEVETELRRSGKTKVANEVVVDGIHTVAVTDDKGKSLVSRPLDGTLDVPGGFELHAALDEGSVLTLRGMAKPSAAFSIVAATDHQRLAQR